MSFITYSGEVPMNVNAGEEEDFEERFRRHLPRSRDLALIVLKGHLLMEEAVERLLASLLVNPAALEKIDISVFVRLRLVRALLPAREIYDVLDAAEKLNTLRNKLAHHLEHPHVERLANEFVRSFEDESVPVSEFEKEPMARRLKRCLGFLGGRLTGYAEGRLAILPMDKK
jgi:hypothetical protein